MTSSSPDSVVEADVLAGELFECEEEEEEEEGEEGVEEEEEEEKEEEEEEGEKNQQTEENSARIKREEDGAAEDVCDLLGVFEPLGSFSRDSHPEGSSCYWYAGEYIVLFLCKPDLKLFQETIRASSRQGRSVKAQEAACSMSHNKTSWRRSPCWRPLKAGRAGGA